MWHDPLGLMPTLLKFQNTWSRSSFDSHPTSPATDATDRATAIPAGRYASPNTTLESAGRGRAAYQSWFSPGRASAGPCSNLRQADPTASCATDPASSQLTFVGTPFPHFLPPLQASAVFVNHSNLPLNNPNYTAFRHAQPDSLIPTTEILYVQSLRPAMDPRWVVPLPEVDRVTPDLPANFLKSTPDMTQDLR